jgi:hypothetical protein
MPGSMNLATGPGILGIAVFLITITFMAIAVINLLPRFWGRKPTPAITPPQAAPVTPAYDNPYAPYVYTARHGYDGQSVAVR